MASSSSARRPGSASGLYTISRPAPSSSSTPRRPAQPKRKKPRTVWNSTDTKSEWDELVAVSSLSTSAPSTRKPRLRGLPSLAKCAADAAARGFKRLWEDEAEPSAGASTTATAPLRGGRDGAEASGSDDLKTELKGRGGSWSVLWEGTPDHLKEPVRDSVFRWWGSYLTIQVLRTFENPPHLRLPGDILPAIASVQQLKPLVPPSDTAESFTSLTLTHAAKAPDVAIAGLIHFLPNLEVINLKGCTLAGKRVVEIIVKRCRRLRRINLKGTAIGEDDLRSLLDEFGQQLEGLKVDNVRFHSSPDKAFASGPFPKITHLCLPGDIINAPSQDFRERAKRFGQIIAHPLPRAAPADALLDWPNFSHLFPALTHLYLPDLLIPTNTTISVPPQQLVKLSLGPGGPPVPLEVITELIESQTSSLRSVHLGHLMTESMTHVGPKWLNLGVALGRCRSLVDFRHQGDPKGSKDARCDNGMADYSMYLYEEGMSGPWQRTLKRLTISTPCKIDPYHFVPEEWISLDLQPALEELNLPSMGFRGMDGNELFAQTIAERYRNLRSLDLSGSSVTDEDVFTILDGCPLISHIDLTSCRGVRVQNRRNIFKFRVGENGAEDRRPGVVT
ncbi:hypothetical protein JCM24511_02759 [Saitozyma sp. JCM 24511]|nr:hypothetical protein JCM24511_02759 [Saitozyma sp. JCM 24511]